MNQHINKTPEKADRATDNGAAVKRGEGHFAVQLADNRQAYRVENSGSSSQPVQRHISWDAVAGQFQLDPTRPGWVDGLAGAPVGPGQSRNHIIDFENIQNDLATILNTIIAANTPGNRAQLTTLTNALIPTPGPARTNMIFWRTALIASINAGIVGNYHTEARALLSLLNSSPDNVRVGDAGINTVIGQNIDADFNPGMVAFAGGMVSTMAAPAGVIVPAQPVLTLTPASNDQVYRYQAVTQQTITFVINPFNNRQLSSVTGPNVGTAAPLPPYPVLVTDPAGAGIPFLFT